jgi:CheY-like chemotaxis protein
LMSVVNDILDFSKIEAGKMELREENCRVRALLDEVTELFAARAELRGVRIAAKIEPDVPSQVEADTERVRQVLSNLVGNAVKFTESGSITVRASVEETEGQQLQLRFEVVDTGIGIDPAVQSKLFEAFSQVDGSLTRKHGGTGLGLAICKQLVLLMKGRMGVSSAPGKGSNFWFVLPLRRLESTANLERASAFDARPFAPPPSSNDSAGSRKILVAEDNPINQEVIREVLSELGYEAHIVDNGLRALTALEEQSYPMVLMDCQMPELDGYGAAREIRRRESTSRRIPLIAVTAHAFEGEREKALAAGMDDYVTKPLNTSVLSEVIQRWWPKPLAREPESGERLASTKTEAGSTSATELSLDPTVARSDAVARVFLKYVPDQVESIGKAIAESDEASLRAAAHKLKGSCLAIGVPRMAEICSQLEEGRGDRAALFSALKGAFARAESELSAQLTRPKTGTG